MEKKTALIILDGWGIGNQDSSDGVYKAHTPFFDQIFKNNNSATLETFGEKVGLPKGQMGNSEVGHLNIGAGRIVYQDLLKIDRAIEDKTFHHHPTILEAIQYAKVNQSTIHLMGLVSTGGVHSSLNHLLSLCDVLKEWPQIPVQIHGFSDGRDCDPHSGKLYFKQLIDHIKDTNINLASIIGRYYAMDRDQRWDRIKKAYDLLINAEGKTYDNCESAFLDQYNLGISDEFIPPISFSQHGKIEDKDVVICFNFRTDRCRQISTVLTQKDFMDFEMKKLDIKYLTMTNYDRTFEGVDVIYDKENIPNTLGEVISVNGKSQLRIAETEKYPHVTYFLSGGRELEFEGENRIVASSPKVATYDLKPEMSAFEVTSSCISFTNENNPDFICLNYANPDMVGHTGVPDAIIKACETVDQCLKELTTFLVGQNYAVLVIADHGNADKMFNEDGSAHTSHTLNLVPVVLMGVDSKITNGKLADVAPTILDLMGLEKPIEMTGVSIIQS